MDALHEPVEPLLASQLIGDEELDELLEDACSISTGKKRVEARLLGTSVKSLDDALEGGLEVGKVTSISSETGGGGSELCRVLLVHSLFKYRHSTAAVIDTSGNFDVLRVYTLILSHLERHPDSLSALRSSSAISHSDAKIEDVAAIVLDRVKIMRVFDFIGVREAIGEVGDALEGRDASTSKAGEAVNERIVDEKQRPPSVVKTPLKRTVVADSEDEEEDDDEEMLFDSEPAVAEPAPAVQDPGHTQHDREQAIEGEDGGKPKMILIDNLASVINPLLKKDYIQANTLASTFLTALTRLTHSHGLHTLLLNPTSAPRSASAPLHPPQNPGQVAPPPPQRAQHPPQPPSVFASNTAVPNLMNVLGRHVDVGLLVTRVPRRKLDARVFYSDGGGSNRGSTVRQGKGPEMIGVMEVMSDRWGGRVGAWGTFVESENGLKDV